MLLQTLSTIMVLVLSIALVLVSVNLIKEKNKVEELRIFAVHNGCAVFTSTDFSGIRFNHEKTQILYNTK